MKNVCVVALIIVGLSHITYSDAESFAKPKKRVQKRASQQELCGQVGTQYFKLIDTNNALIREITVLNDAISKQGYALASDAKESAVGKASAVQLESYNETLSVMRERQQMIMREITSMQHQVNCIVPLEKSVETK